MTYHFWIPTISATLWFDREIATLNYTRDRAPTAALRQKRPFNYSGNLTPDNRWHDSISWSCKRMSLTSWFGTRKPMW